MPKMNSRLNYVTPDTMAECYNGVSKELYSRLWDSMSNMKPLSEQIDMEDSSPSDAVGLNSIASVWDFFTDEEKTQINEIVERN